MCLYLKIRPLRSQLKLNKVLRLGPWPNMTDVLTKGGREVRDTHAQSKARWEYSKVVAVCKPRTEASGEIQPAGTLILDFWPTEL